MGKKKSKKESCDFDRRVEEFLASDETKAIAKRFAAEQNITEEKVLSVIKLLIIANEYG